MSKVLLTNSYLYPLDAKQWATHQPYPPLGTLQAAAVLRQQGHLVSVFDVSLEHDAATIEGSLQSIKPHYFVIYDDGFNYLTKMCLTVMRTAAFTMMRVAKRLGCHVIVSSSDSTDHYAMYLNQGADYVIKGEAEETLSELIEALDNQGEVKHINGLAFLGKDGSVVVSSPRAVMKNLDGLPLPAWDLINLEPYKKIWHRYHGYFSLNIATTRGCPFKCNWCAKPIYGNRYNSRSPQHVVDEIEFILNHYRPTHFWMCDDIFGLKPGWIQEFNREVQLRKLKFKYKIQSRVDLLLQSDTIDALVQSGVEMVWVGAESGSQKILDAMDKGTTVDQIHEATRLLQSKGAKVAFFLQFGYPGETKIDIDKTLKMVLHLLPDEIGISVSYPLPGTPFYQNVKMQMGSKQNWVDSDDLALMFENTYPAPFYKVLHRYVHARYRMKKNGRLVAQWLRQPVAHRISLKKIFSLPYFFISSLWLKVHLLYFSSTGHRAIITSVNAAFSKQATHYDADDRANPILQQWRQIVYEHTESFMPANSRILELNSGTGIDAMHFIRQGHSVQAVELSQGMVAQLRMKSSHANGRLQIHHGSFERLPEVDGTFDYVFSNFGGLNCSSDLRNVTRHLAAKLKPNAFVTWVIMPPFCPWEIMWVLKGHFKQAFRRFHRKGVIAHLEGEYFRTYYYGLNDVRQALGRDFTLIKCEGLGIVSPPPSAVSFISRYPRLYKILVNADAVLRKRFPFNRMGDHLIITFQFNGVTQPS